RGVGRGTQEAGQRAQDLLAELLRLVRRPAITGSGRREWVVLVGLVVDAAAAPLLTYAHASPPWKRRRRQRGSPRDTSSGRRHAPTCLAISASTMEAGKRNGGRRPAPASGPPGPSSISSRTRRTRRPRRSRVRSSIPPPSSSGMTTSCAAPRAR